MNKSIAMRTLTANLIVAAGLIGEAQSVEVDSDKVFAVSEALIPLLGHLAVEGEVSPQELIVAMLMQADCMAISKLSADACVEHKLEDVEEMVALCESLADSYISQKESAVGVKKEPEFDAPDELAEALALFQGMRGTA